MAKKNILTGDQAGKYETFASQLPKTADAVVSRRRTHGSNPKHHPEAYEKGFAAGYDSGFERGMNEAEKLEARRLAQFTEDLAALKARVEEGMNLWFQKAEHGLGELSAEIARRVINDELTSRPDAILGIVKEALGRVQNSVSARVRVNPFDLAALEERRDMLQAACQSVHDFEIVADNTLSRGSTVIESEGGVIDARVESKIGHLLGSEEAA